MSGFRVVASVVFTTVATAGCGSSGPSEPAFARANNIAISRADGSGIGFAPTVYAWCGAWEPGVVAEPTAHVIVGDASARWELRIVQRDARPGETQSFPNSFIWDEPRGADMFIHDPPNELSTQTGASSGAVTSTGWIAAPGAASASPSMRSWAVNWATCRRSLSLGGDIRDRDVEEWSLACSAQRSDPSGRHQPQASSMITVSDTHLVEPVRPL